MLKRVPVSLLGVALVYSTPAVLKLVFAFPKIKTIMQQYDEAYSGTQCNIVKFMPCQ